MRSKIPYMRAKERHDKNKQHIEPTSEMQAINYENFCHEIPDDMEEAVRLA